MGHPKLPFSPSVTKDNFVFTSGQVYLTPEGKLLEGSIKEQTHQVMKNLKGVLEKAGVNEIYGSYFSEPYPARETVCVKELPMGAKIEISLIASKG